MSTADLEEAVARVQMEQDPVQTGSWVPTQELKNLEKIVFLQVTAASILNLVQADIQALFHA